MTSPTTASLSSDVLPLNITSAPYPCVAAILEGVEIVGITMYAWTPRVRAARANACAWLPV